MSSGYVKDLSALTMLASGVEMPLDLQDGLITPNDRFFLCHAEPTPVVQAQGWSLGIEGNGVTTPLCLSLADLQAMEQVTVRAVIECAGNQRQLFEDVLGEPLNRRPEETELRWTLGGVGMADWRGVRLRDVLERAGITDDACHVMPISIDTSDEEPDGMRIPLPAAKALDPDTLIALEMNGEPLPADHGFPARLITPGWVGTYSIKWLDRIEVSREHRWVARNTLRYVMMGEAWADRNWSPARGPQITEHPVRSSLALPWSGATLAPGQHRLHGFARGGETAIVHVTWSSDGGTTWRDAELLSPSQRYAWVRFACDW
ncbi:MAG: molybdopterin-dependent oxidoreductase, partial [Rhodospirillaceae bacterium]|nr:molybdopterin-dependent oxidoreductase [Rhodospirillaceae bacterium]